MTEDYYPHEWFPTKAIDFGSVPDQALKDLRSFLARVDRYINTLVRHHLIAKGELHIVSDYFDYSARIQRDDFDEKKMLDLTFEALFRAISVVDAVKERATVRMHKVNALLTE
jgi:hypothetical protein